MKKIILSILTMATLGASAQNVNIPDANFKAYLVGNTAINTNSDTEIQVSEASAFSGLINCTGLSISDLTGIEAFTALTDLNCFLNSITTIDLSQNTALLFLQLSANPLTSLNISTNTALLTLKCNSTSLTSLDISNNTNISNVWCNSSSLTSLTVGSNTTLIQLECSSNALTNIDVSMAPNLYTFYCDFNALTSLDLSNNVGLTNLKCQVNALTSLNIANGNNTVISVYNSTFNPNLTCIEVDDVAYSTTNWTSVDPVSSYSLSCGPPLCTVNIPDANFKAYLVGNTSINTNGNTEIECSEATAFTGFINCNSLSITDLTGIEAFTALTELYCNDNFLTSIDLTQNTALTYLHCYQNLLTTLNVSQIVDLGHINCWGNQLTSIDVSTNINLTYFVVGLNSLTTLDMSQNLLLNVLDCRDNLITNLDLSQHTNLNQLFCLNNSLTSLNLTNGSNTSLFIFYATNNPNLTCIQVDDAAYSTTNWTNIDAQTSFNTNCNGTLGINQTIQNLNLSIYPNPTTGIITVSTTEQINSIEIYTLTGQKVAMFNNVNTIDISSFPKGMYTAKVTSTSKIGVIKLIKE
jgi:hypothetical protein